MKTRPWGTFQFRSTPRKPRMSMRRTSGSPQAVQTGAQLTETPTPLHVAPLHVASPVAMANRPLLKEAGALGSQGQSPRGHLWRQEGCHTNQPTANTAWVKPGPTIPDNVPKLKKLTMPTDRYHAHSPQTLFHIHCEISQSTKPFPPCSPHSRPQACLACYL